MKVVSESLSLQYELTATGKISEKQKKIFPGYIKFVFCFLVLGFRL
jgi:hypothetical protein